MEFSLKSAVLFGAVVFTGLSAGLFYAWSVSVIPGTQKVADATYLESMQSINRAILNPAFFLIFFGSVLFLSAASIYQLYTNHLTFWLMLSASICYLIGTIGVTGLGNVPLNDQLDALQLTGLDSTRLQAFREHYEVNWNRFHLIRTMAAIVSFMLSVASIFSSIKQ